MPIPTGTTLRQACELFSAAKKRLDLNSMKEVRDYIKHQIPPEQNYLKLEWTDANIERLERGGNQTPRDEDTMKERLMSKYDYSEEEATLAANWIRNVGGSEKVFLAVREWWEFDRAAEVEVNGVKMTDLVDRFGFTIPAAIVMLDALRDTPNLDIGPVALVGDPFKNAIQAANEAE